MRGFLWYISELLLPICTVICIIIPMINRAIEKELSLLTREFPIIAILGPRQSGKTTLAKKLFNSFTYISLEDLDNREFAVNDPRGFLEKYQRSIILDEIQRVPSLISYLQTHADQTSETGQFVITGSHNYLLMERISQSLAGRIGISILLPFSAEELRLLERNLETLLFKGSYPRIYDKHIRAQSFYKNYISTYIEKDVRLIKNITKLDAFLKFMKLLAGRTGQILNFAPLSNECGVSHNTIKDWLSVLESSFLIYKLRPYHRNYNKRLVKNPKIYFTDTGLLCHLLGIRRKEELDFHYLKGGIFENFIIMEFVKENYNTGEPYSLHFWRDNHQKEIDLIVDFGWKRYGIEIKSAKTIQEKHFDNLRYWSNLTGESNENMYLIYAGISSMVRNGFNVAGWPHAVRKEEKA